MSRVVITLIQAERNRQILDEGWTEEHDDAHTDGSLAAAAACYAHPFRPETDVPSTWPWSSDWWKPTPDDRIRELVKAGALICAEIDRLFRIARKKEAQEAKHAVLQRENFLVRSGDGYLCDRSTLEMSSERADALLLTRDVAEEVARILSARGLSADVVDDLFNPARMPPRDEDGMACHPDIFMREWYDGDPADEAPFLSERLHMAGWEIWSVDIDSELLEDQHGEPLQDEAHNAAIARWQPAPPDLSWQLIAVFDSEEGPQASFVRRRSNEGARALGGAS